jgi:hypothetical protein
MKTKDLEDAWYVELDLTIMEPDCGGTTSPKLRIDPPQLDEQTEDEFVHRAERMLRNAFQAARQQWANKLSTKR